MQLYSDGTEKLIGLMLYNKTDNARFYHYWLLKCPLKCVPDLSAGALFGGYFNM